MNRSDQSNETWYWGTRVYFDWINYDREWE